MRHIPNLITLSRLLGCVLVALLFFNHAYVAMLVVYVAIELLDQADGKVAKAFHLQSTTGMYFDGFVDSLTHLTAFACLLSIGVLPTWMYLVFLFREFSLIFLRLLATVQGVLFGGHFPGKAKALVHAVVIILVFFKLASGTTHPFFTPAIWLPWAVAASLGSGVYYYYKYFFVVKRAFLLEVSRAETQDRAGL